MTEISACYIIIKLKAISLHDINNEVSIVHMKLLV